jgi:quercetin 2,3-dioxygenase
MNARTVERIVQGQATSDGAGVKLTRVLTQDLQQRLDPFLMLDAFRNDNPDDYMGGFPDHPHRGFETVTYMLHGRMRHHDSAGNSGLLQGGGAQWMTAGRGLVHSEMPEQENGLMEGFQLWVNLPGKNKMMAPVYRDLVPDQIPTWALNDGVSLRMIAGGLELRQRGSSQRFEGPVQRPDTEPIFADLHFSQASSLSLSIPAGHNAFIYTYRGDMLVGDEPNQRSVADTRMGILSKVSESASGDSSSIELSCVDASRCIVVAGRPLREPIAQYGPFVMNTREEVMQAFQDFQSGLIRN